MVQFGWYDSFAPVYDVGTLGDVFYRGPRKAAIRQLALHEGAKVFDIFCGTGINFPILAEQIGETGRILGVDGSPGMLERAHARAARRQGMPPEIGFLQADLGSEIGMEELCAAIRVERPYHILFTLGLTCLSNWESLCEKVIASAPAGARVSIMDVYSSRLTLGARFINWVGAADCRRRVWEVLEGAMDSYEWCEYRPFKVLDVSVITASGTKR
jgi:demethylmenaquinone methyltransferase/2-methoxy-6-polyprenyl-1,4-benzoquinol methylase